MLFVKIFNFRLNHQAPALSNIMSPPAPIFCFINSFIPTQHTCDE